MRLIRVLILVVGNYCGVGATVYDDDGKAHVVEHDGVAKHPGDSGRKEIADRIIEKLKNQE
ncbi:hypothetical protein [Pseudobutyrivibrio sp. JW11]|uniref:hypothetical protein n=1 Tax=Pseudobutyrivibrio sp. JW11 TaxID=1855302 RepID=UPI000B854F75|nr:hypothetical protein [Pseudobutyrivibrio sp. JW11]